MNLSNKRFSNIRPELHETCLRNRSMILGVTGGIASGKSSVATMLEKMGLPVLDFDVLARQVVEPGQTAWNDIVSRFGRDILNNKQEIDRKKLSGIVFNDEKRRKELEEITHPRITDQYMIAIDKIAREKPNCIIQSVIPLLFEVNLEGLVHKILLVYIPREKQVERLMDRDKIKREDALKIINAQLPIEDKIEKADFVVNNEDSPEETVKVVKRLYKKLLKAHMDLMNLTA